MVNEDGVFQTLVFGIFSVFRFFIVFVVSLFSLDIFNIGLVLSIFI